MILVLAVAAAGMLLAGCSTTSTTSSSPFPDPYSVSQGHTTITFVDLPAVCTIEVYSLAGRKVRSITETDGDGESTWDVKNDAGESLVSGIYTYIIKSANDEQKGKVIITK